ncbi:receptor-like protein EIX2 [Silene latifolia]|uniref:receptor-like protein EIX2 n=1 Tax=Silene latifolia TaxID=37657 RepID=UPI003D76ED71
MHFRNVSNLSIVISLNLRGNDLSGVIPSELCSLSDLVFMDLADNYFTGQIPPCFGLIFQRSSIGETKYPRIEVTEIIKRQQEVFIGPSWLASNLDLSNNNLVGTIPEAMTNISTLVGLNLSYNHLTGGIPEKIGSMISLESLDLSNNYLSGTIPDSLSSLTALSSLNLSNNYLHGQIPTGSQLQTLDDPSIYTGNRGLYGFPLQDDFNKPSSPPSQTNHDGENDDKKEHEHERYWLYQSIMIGFATGFWGVVGTLVLNISWRHAYFRFVEEIANKIYVQFKVKVNRCMKRLNHDQR